MKDTDSLVLSSHVLVTPIVHFGSFLQIARHFTSLRLLDLTCQRNTVRLPQILYPYVKLMDHNLKRKLDNVIKLLRNTDKNLLM